MSVIKDLKSKFSSIAWCPEKEHASVMAIATMKDLTPVESESPKSLSLYDWRLDNVTESQMVAEESLPAGICCLNWSCVSLPDRENIKSLIALGMSDGSVEFWLPSYTQETGWSLDHVCFRIRGLMIDILCFGFHFVCPVDLFKLPQQWYPALCWLPRWKCIPS